MVQSPGDLNIVAVVGSPGYDLLLSVPETNWANQTKRISGVALTSPGGEPFPDVEGTSDAG